ncbi:Hypothetical protein, putative [Bodo saltans]|uniref:Uncharacterized protein n=1 Tax=Bodo saltans TaxID=75058 RepID=A0A0S4JWD9_BODSA|nr:Hypothetical protein, putative [Bodo saltans]|eukprot:CUG93745.1 Hypothetical protein, putative [Bodo saltans]
MKRHVHFPPCDEVTVVHFELSAAEYEAREPWPVYVSLEHELSDLLSPKYPALDALSSSTDIIYDTLCRLPKYSTELDDILIPLVEYIRRHSSVNQTRQQQMKRVFAKSCSVVEVFAAALSDPAAASAHHTLLRPIKELVVFPGEATCPTKQAFLSKLRRDYFPRAPCGG